MPSREARGPVMWDVAAAAKVSQKTVSRVVNDAPHVSPAVRARVQDAIRELGYRPNPAARALVTQRTHTIGVVAVGTPQYGPATRVFGLERSARVHGYELALASPADTAVEHIREAIETLLRRGIEGIALEVPDQPSIDPELIAGIPIASNVGTIPGIDQQVVVGVDQVDGGAIATRSMLELGHQGVAHIAGPDAWRAARDRRRGWAQAEAAGGFPPSPIYHGDWSARSGYRAGVRLLTDHPETTAIFAANDQMAIGVMRAATEAGRSIPDDLSIVGFDDVPEAEFLAVPLTTVRTDSFAISERILAELVALIEGGEPSPPVHFPNELVVRRSSGSAPAPRTRSDKP